MDRYQDPTDDGASEPVRCPVCAGFGWMDWDDDVCAGLIDCTECGGIGEITPEQARRLGHERASCVSISSYLDDRQ